MSSSYVLHDPKDCFCILVTLLVVPLHGRKRKETHHTCSVYNTSELGQMIS